MMSEETHEPMSDERFIEIATVIIAKLKKLRGEEN